jgi:hypothetical protein
MGLSIKDTRGQTIEKMTGGLLINRLTASWVLAHLDAGMAVKRFPIGLFPHQCLFLPKERKCVAIFRIG